MKAATAIEGVLSDEIRHAQMQRALESGLPFLEPATGFHDRTMSIVGYGPSLLSTWQQIPRPIMATSGAYDFLAERLDRPPDYYVAMDPRRSIIDLLAWPEEETSYLMATVCHPEWWSWLAGFDVRLWHLVNNEATLPWIANNHPEGLHVAIGGGCTVGQRAMNVAARMGYRKFNVFGIDCSFPYTANTAEHRRHAGPHNAEHQPEQSVIVGGKHYRTTPQWLQSAKELHQFVNTCDVEVNFHGEGLIQDLVSRGKKVLI